MKNFILILTVILAFGNILIAQDNVKSKNTATELAPQKNTVTDISGLNELSAFGGRWFGQNAAVTSFFTKGFLNNTASHSNFGPGSTSLYGAMEFDNTGKLYCIAVAASSPLQLLDTTTGALTSQGAITGLGAEQVLGMSFNKVNNTMYLTTTLAGGDKLYTLDLTTRVATFIANLGQNFFDIAINSTGLAYGVTVTDFLYSINLTTGVATSIGPTGFDANFIQGLSFDRQTDTLWYAAYNNTVGIQRGELRKVNLTTGATTLISPFTPAAEICGFCIPSATAPSTSCLYNWGAQTSGVASTLYGISAVNNNVAWSCGATNVVRRTVNGGSTWASANGGGMTGTIYDIEGIDSNIAVATTSDGVGTVIYRTSNGGASWVSVFTQAGGFINDIDMISATEGYAEGDPVNSLWAILRTTNGGINWAPIPGAPASAAGEFGRIDNMSVTGTNIRFVSDASKVYISSNSGTTWTTVTVTGFSNSGTGTICAHFTDANTGYIAALTMLKTVNGGASWTTVTVPGTAGFTNIDGFGNEIWTLRASVVYRSSNGGTNWTTAYTGTGVLQDIDLVLNAGCPVGWTSSSNGTIAKMSSSLVGISSYNLEVPEGYALSQNYPNPFNPSTNISFSIPKSGFVSLKVYNTAGKELATLVNEHKQAGNYIIGFNAINLPSGAYFYKIETNNFVETRKMLLIK